MMGWLSAWFGFAMGLSAFLLFWVQPLIGRWLLPRYGGAPAVWLTCLFFFQALLLAGYAYAHALARWLRPTWQVAVHGTLLTCCLLLLLPPRPANVPGLSPAEHPTLSLLLVLAASVGAPAFALCATAPLMQHWFSLAAGSKADPYPLYAASNAGSLLAVVAAPFLLDAQLELRQQSWAWVGGFVLFILAGAECARLAFRAQRGKLRHPRSVAPPSAPPITATDRLCWLLLSLAPSSLLLSTSQHITENLAPVPLLWMLPLGVYLGTFIVAFSTVGRPWALATRPLALLAAVVMVPFALTRGNFLEDWLSSRTLLATNLSLSVLTLALLGLSCHGMLAAAAPPPARLTEFYLLVSLGGVLGSALNSLLGPVLFRDHVEYYIALAAAVWLLPASESLQGRCNWRRDALAASCVLVVAVLCYLYLPLPVPQRLAIPPLACLAALAWPVRVGPMFASVAAVIVATHYIPQPWDLHRERTFFGVLSVNSLALTREGGAGPRHHKLVHGTTLHGLQVFGVPAPLATLPLTYYTGPGPIGQVFAVEEKKPARPVGVIGLGVGTLAAYGRPGQRFTFYEIDPAVERIARNPALFTFLQDSKAECKVVLGDARLRLEEAEDGEFGVLVIDAFSSDSIPVHLITSDAIDLYLSKLHEGGVIAFHISNEYLDLEPVLGNIARARSLPCLAQYSPMTPRDEARGLRSSHWVVMARNKETLAALARNPGWKPARTNPRLGVWTDQFAKVLSAFK